MMNRCPKCRGQRQYMGAGMIMHKCSACLGLGRIVEPDPVAEENIEEMEKEELPKQKRKYTRKEKHVQRET